LLIIIKFSTEACLLELLEQVFNARSASYIKDIIKNKSEKLAN
jgi:hypothetical protein